MQRSTGALPPPAIGDQERSGAIVPLPVEEEGPLTQQREFVPVARIMKRSKPTAASVTPPAADVVAKGESALVSSSVSSSMVSTPVGRESAFEEYERVRNRIFEDSAGNNNDVAAAVSEPHSPAPLGGAKRVHEADLSEYNRSRRAPPAPNSAARSQPPPAPWTQPYHAPNQTLYPNQNMGPRVQPYEPRCVTSGAQAKSPTGAQPYVVVGYPGAPPIPPPRHQLSAAAADWEPFQPQPKPVHSSVPQQPRTGQFNHPASGPYAQSHPQPPRDWRPMLPPQQAQNTRPHNYSSTNDYQQSPHNTSHSWAT